MKVKIGIVGYGYFSRDFINLFSKHPDVEKICIAELVPERREEIRRDHPGFEVYSSYEDMLDHKADINCVGIFTQRHLHAKMVIQALKAGKNVFSAVPIACTIEDIEEIVRLVEKTGLIYMMAETCYYYPDAIFCREKYKEGAFGKFTYAEAQYYHDIREMYHDFSHSGGPNWKRVAGIPPMFYPTHSISEIFPAIGQHAVKVSCMGYRDDFPDEIYGEKLNDFENPFSNETAIFRMSGGGVVRINEFRRVGINKPSTYITCFYGEQGAYDRIADKFYFQTAPYIDRNGNTPQRTLTDVSELLLPYYYKKLRDGQLKPEEITRPWDENTSKINVDVIVGGADIQDKTRLPKSFREDHPTGHMNSHPYLVDDFCRAVVEEKLPPNNAWDAARYMVPGLVAHQSALKDGELLEVPDFGEAPAKFERLTYTKKDYYED